MVGLLVVVVVVGVRVNRRLSDGLADDIVFMRVPGMCGVLPLIARNYDF